MIRFCFTHNQGWYGGNHIVDWQCEDRPLTIERFIEIEVYRQGFILPPEHKKHCLFMRNAWDYAIKQRRGGLTYPNVDFIMVIGNLVQPYMNVFGRFREINLYSGKTMTKIGIDHSQINRAIPNLIVNGRDLDPEEWYKEYEEIHPFEDGNGRTGKILYNFLRDSLENPSFPPDYFGHGVP